MADGRAVVRGCAPVHEGVAAQVWPDAAEGVREGDNARRCDAQDGMVLSQDEDTADVGRRGVPGAADAEKGGMVTLAAKPQGTLNRKDG